MIFYWVGFFCLVSLVAALVIRHSTKNDHGGAQMTGGEAMTPDWTSMKICYWPNGTWCYHWEREQMSHMSDDYAVVEMLPGKPPIDIDNEVQELIKRGYK